MGYLTPCRLVQFRIKILDKDTLFSGHAAEIVPSVVAVEFYEIILAQMMRIDNVMRHEIFGCETLSVHHSKRSILQWLDKRTPNTDDKN